jgi:thymidylate synthase (FAD)
MENNNTTSNLEGLGNVELIDHMGSDLSVVNAARVSFSKESEYIVNEQNHTTLSKKDKDLIAYLAAHNHWTPFAHTAITFRITAPISIRTQMFKHKFGFVENEVSRRYVHHEPEWYHPIWRAAPTDGAKQGSSGLFTPKNEDELIYLDSSYHFAFVSCMEAYHKLIKVGIAPEQARFVLPQGCLTEWIWTGSLAAYSRFYKLRSDPSAQWEVQQFAEKISSFLQLLFPISWEALTKQE